MQYIVKFTVNNYVLGAKIKSTPTEKIINYKRIDANHVEVFYQISLQEIKYCEKILAQKHTLIKLCY